MSVGFVPMNYHSEPFGYFSRILCQLKQMLEVQESIPISKSKVLSCNANEKCFIEGVIIM